MRLLTINAVYGVGSTGIIVRDIHRLATESGIESYVACSTAGEKGENVFTFGSTLSKKAHALLCRINGKQAYFSRLSTARLISYIRKLKPDIVHLHNLHSNYINLNMLLRFLGKEGVKTVLTLHDCWFFTGGCFHYTAASCQRFKTGCGDCPKKRLDTPAYLFDRSQKILRDRKKYFSLIKNLYPVGVSDWIAREAEKSIFKDVRTIHNGVDTDVFAPSGERLFGDGFVILGPASKWLKVENREALEKLSAAFSEDRIVLFGSDKRDDLPKNVTTQPYTKSQKELAKIYASADVFVNCTREDSLPTVNLEAESSGVPVVTYDATGALETVPDRELFAVQTGDIDDLIAKVEDIKAKGKGFYSEGVRSHIIKEFEKGKNYRKYLELYNEIMAL